MTQTADERREARRLAKRRQRQRESFRADVQQWLGADIEQARKMLANDPELFDALEDAYREQYPPLERGNGNNTYPMYGEWVTVEAEDGERTRTNEAWKRLYDDYIPLDPADYKFHVTDLESEDRQNYLRQRLPGELFPKKVSPAGCHQRE